MSQPFKVVRGEGSLQVDFTEPAFDLFRELPSLYRHLFARLGRLGLTLADMRHQPGDNLGEFNFLAFLLGFRATVRLRLDGAEIRCGELLQVEEKDLEELTVQALGAIRACFPSLSFRTYTLILAYHALLPGTAPRDFLAHFTSEPPTGLGPPMGSGAVFYYGADSGQIASSVNIDLSAVIENGLFVRTHITWDAAKVEAGALAELARNHRDRVLASLSLEWSE